jgi:hypothetical protein
VFHIAIVGACFKCQDAGEECDLVAGPEEAYRIVGDRLVRGPRPMGMRRERFNVRPVRTR